jgi:hypothetical protein
MKALLLYRRRAFSLLEQELRHQGSSSKTQFRIRLFTEQSVLYHLMTNNHVLCDKK